MLLTNENRDTTVILKDKNSFLNNTALSSQSLDILKNKSVTGKIKQYLILQITFTFCRLSSSSSSVFCPRAGPSLQAQNQGSSSIEGRSSTANSGIKYAVLTVMNRCGSFPLLSAPHSFFSIWTYLKRSEKIPGSPIWRWGEWIWLTGLSDFTEIHHRVYISYSIYIYLFHQGFWPDQSSGNPNHPSHPL